MQSKGEAISLSGRIPGSHLVPQDTLAQVLPKLSKMGSEVGGDIPDPDGVRHTIFAETWAWSDDDLSNNRAGRELC